MNGSTGETATLSRWRPTAWVQVSAILLLLFSLLALVPALQFTVVTADVAARELHATVWDTRPASAREYHAVSPWIDVSMVTPLVIDFTLLRMALGAVCLLGWTRRAATWIHSPTFPFPKGYRGFFVQYGLLGTVYGLILAFWELDLHVEEVGRQTQQLLTGMGAALWSTLTGLTLAYVWCPLMGSLYRGLARGAGIAAYAAPGSAVGGFVEQVRAASGAMEELEMRAKQLAVDLGLGARVTSLQSAVERLQSREQETKEQLKHIEEMLLGVASDLGEAKLTLDKVEALEERLRLCTTDIQAVDRVLQELPEKLKSLRAGRS